QFRVPHLQKSPGVQDGFRVTWAYEGKHVLSFGGSGRDNTGYFYQDGQVNKIVFPDGPGLPSTNVVYLTHDSKILFSYLGYLYSIDKEGEVEMKQFPGTIVGLDEDRAGNIWVSMFYGGVY